MFLATEGFLRTINVSEEGIKKYRDMLAESTSSLENLAKGQGKSGELDGAFGASPRGNELAHHTALAQQEVTKAIQLIAAGLQGYNTNMSLAVADAVAADDHNSAGFRRFETATSCIQGRDFTRDTVNNQCSPGDQG